MNHPITITAVLLWCAQLAVAQPSARATVSACKTLEASERESVSRYVVAKYKLPITLTLDVNDIILNDSCYHRLEFTSQDSHRPWHLVAFASPDLRFLSRDLMDLRIDPREEERALKRDLVARLASVHNAPSIGPKDAPVTVVVFSDFQCPYCAQAAKGLVRDILPDNSSTVKMEFHHYPLPMHPWAHLASEAAACAEKQGENYFWALHDYFFDHQKELRPETIRQAVDEYAQGLSGFKPDELKTCLDNKITSALIDRDIALGSSVGVTGTPTLFVNGERVGGYQADQIRALIERGKTTSAERKDGAGQK